MDDFYVYYNKYFIKNELSNYSEQEMDAKALINSNDIPSKIGGILFVFNTNNELLWENYDGNSAEVLNTTQIEEIKNNAISHIDEGYFLISNDTDLLNRRLLYGHILDSGELIIVAKFMGIVQEVRQIFMMFFAITTIIIFIITFIITYFTAKFISKPIIRLKNATENMASLDFTTSLPKNRNDEIGELMTSINIMAKKLSHNIEALNDSNAQLERELSKKKNLENMRRRFVSDVSHELKNPVSMIIAYAEGLQKHIPKSQEDQEYYYQIILEEGQRMNRLIKDLLDLSSYESGTFTIQKEAVDLTELIENALERFIYISQEKSIDVKFNRINHCIIYGDRLRLGQVIINLMSNAFKNTDQNGKILVSLEQYQHKEKLTICNTGSLIPKSELNNIFKSFYQLETNTEGNGLGLAIVKSIITLHGGKIRAYIKDDMNCFEVIL
jgi:signal transduction histidine kinase